MFSFRFSPEVGWTGVKDGAPWRRTVKSIISNVSTSVAQRSGYRLARRAEF
jgi:hypothetical protein